MADDQAPRGRVDAEEAQRLSADIDADTFPGPVLDQNAPAPMPLFNEHERAGREIHSAIDPAEFAALDDRTGDELDRVEPMADADAPGIAARAAEVRPDIYDDSVGS